MTTLYQTYVFQDGKFHRFEAETVDVDGVRYVRHGDSLQRDTGWYQTRAEADQAAALELRARIDQLLERIAQLNLPLPAQTAAADGSAAGRAHAEVAT